MGLPVLGYLPFLNVFDLGGSFSNLSKKFGDVFSLKVGTQMAVVLNSEEAIKKAFAKSEMCSRPDTFMFRFFSRGEHGIASSSGETWEVQRKFAHKNLKTLGFGKSKMEAFVKDEARELIDILEEKSKSGNPVEIGYDINVAVANIVWALISGQRRAHDDKFLHLFLRAVNKSIELASTSGILLFMPFLAKVLPERLLGISQIKKWMKETDKQVSEIIQEHKASDSESFEPSSKRDFIDSFLAEMKKDGCHESFTEFQLLVLCTELFGAGGEPTSVTLKWALKYLAQNQDVLRKAQAEIDQVVGKDRQVSLEDRDQLHYVQALVHEVIRLADIHPIGVVHSPSKDTEIDGFTIPKGTFVFPNFHKVLRSPEHWEKPNELFPEHFLDESGRFLGGKREGFISFGFGKRKCPGQDMAIMELFLFLSNLIQKFDFSHSQGEEKID